MKIGYASTRPHHGPPSHVQRASLLGRGCRAVFDDGGATGPNDRPGLIDALCACGTGDALMVWHVRTLGGSLDELAWLFAHMGKRQIGLKTVSPWIFDLNRARPRFAQLVSILLQQGATA